MLSLKKVELIADRIIVAWDGSIYKKINKHNADMRETFRTCSFYYLSEKWIVVFCDSFGFMWEKIFDYIVSGDRDVLLMDAWVLMLLYADEKVALITYSSEYLWRHFNSLISFANDNKLSEPLETQ